MTSRGSPAVIDKQDQSSDSESTKVTKVWSGLYVLKVRHSICPGDQPEFTNVANNHEELRKCIFISDDMEKGMLIVEEVFCRDESSTTIHDTFFWLCPTCKTPFKNM